MRLLRIALLGIAALALSSCGASSPFSAGPPTPPAWDNHADQSLRLPDGVNCYDWLSRLGIDYERTQPFAGMRNPVHVKGPIGGIRYTSAGQPGILCDCRLVLALDWSARTLGPMGITQIQHSGAYVYRTTKSGRPSLHARGLAIDVHGLTYRDHTDWIERDFEKGLGDGCEPSAPEVNQVACRLRNLRLFRELITPDHNWDHHDHIHLGIMPL